VKRISVDELSKQLTHNFKMYTHL